MIGYLIKSTVCLAILLLVYLLALEREKMHRFNRVYLLLGLLLALIIPFLPSGEVIHQTYTSSPVIFIDGSGTIMHESVVQMKSFTWFSWERLLLSIYSIVLAVMLIKFVRNVSQLIHKAYSNPKEYYRGAQLVLLKEEVLPHTFLGYIYVNEDQFHNGEIDEKLLAHEYAHATQRHSWDVIIIELLKAIYWFNPLLILYKLVIQLNHEFLADEAVIQQYRDVSNYQHLLVDTCQNNNQIYLASNINFFLTKKRLTMMTKESSRKRTYMLMAGVVPVVIALVMMLGQPVIAQSNTQNDPITKDQFFKDAIVHYKTTDGRIMVKSYNSLPLYVKDLLPPPPPLPPALLGEKESTVMQPLEKGTVVHLKPNGSVLIGNDSGGDIEFPMPPAPPKAPNAPNAPKAPNAPNASNAPNAPNPPKSLKTIRIIPPSSPVPESYEMLKKKEW